MGMIIRGEGLETGNRRVRFGYSDVEYQDLFPKSEHIGYLRIVKDKGTYLFGVDEVIRDTQGGILRALSVRVPGEKELLIRALREDFGVKTTRCPFTLSS